MNPNAAIDLRRVMTGVLLVGASLMVQKANAELRCDCSQIVDTCSASVSLNSNTINIESTSKACSRVDYLIDGQPFAALVVDGKAGFSLGGLPLAGTQIVVENCRVCADSTANNVAAPSQPTAPASTSGGGDEDGGEDNGMRPLVKVMPAYPRRAWGAGLEGRVSVEYDVSAEGIVQNIRVIASSDPVFINATIDAMSRFRFPPGEAKGLREEFYFRLIGGSEPSVTSNTL